jgi:hypothetical protein
MIYPTYPLNGEWKEILQINENHLDPGGSFGLKRFELDRLAFELAQIQVVVKALLIQ